MEGFHQLYARYELIENCPYVNLLNKFTHFIKNVRLIIEQLENKAPALNRLRI